jgi:hypothetical protein
MKQTPNIGRTAALVANGSRRVNQRTLGDCTKKGNRVEQVRFADPVGACDARKRTEPNVHPD